MNQPTLVTSRLRLRSWTMEDAAEFHRLWGDARVIWWGHSPAPEASLGRLADVLARCAAMANGLGWWALEERENGRLVGNAVLQPAPYDQTIELGYHLMRESWGQGFATEAACAVLSHGFSTLALPVISAVVHVEKQASQRVVARAGLRLTGPLTFNEMPHLRYELTREESRALDWAAASAPG